MESEYKTKEELSKFYQETFAVNPQGAGDVLAERMFELERLNVEMNQRLLDLKDLLQILETELEELLK